MFNIQKKQAIKGYGRELNRSQIGVYLSHIKLWQGMVDKNISQALILEDDTFVGQSLLPLLQCLDKLPADWGALTMRTDPPLKPIGIPLFDNYRVALLRNPSLSI